MNAALDRYENVFQVSGHMFDMPELRTSDTAVLLPFTTTWGWATWRRAWQQLDTAFAGWERLQTDRAFRRRFNLDGSYDCAAMLERQMRARADSWGIRWYWSVFNRNGLCVYPPRSPVENRGLDGIGSDGRGSVRRFTGAAVRDDGITAQPEAVMDLAAFAAVKAAIYRQNSGAIGMVVDHLKALLR